LLEEYSGTVFLVSHDRMFLDNVVTQVIVAEGAGDWQEYIGGYTDWERVRAAAASRPAAPKAEAKTLPRESAPAVKPKKLSYKEQRELDELPALIAALEAEQKAISEKLAATDFYRKQPDEAKKLNQRFAEIDGQLLETLEKWESIEAKGKG
jgi:ATP-binding cassette subfamily F protein uup